MAVADGFQHLKTAMPTESYGNSGLDGQRGERVVRQRGFAQPGG